MKRFYIYIYIVTSIPLDNKPFDINKTKHTMMKNGSSRTSPNFLPTLLTRIVILIITILCLTVQPSLGIERIKRLHSRTIWLNQGDTVKLEWTASVSGDQLILFHCGYKNDGIYFSFFLFFSIFCLH